MEYSQFEVFQVVESGCALAHADDSFGAIVFIIPNKNQQFYDEQKIVLKKTNVHNVSERISIVPKWK